MKQGKRLEKYYLRKRELIERLNRHPSAAVAASVIFMIVAIVSPKRKVKSWWGKQVSEG